MVNIKKNLLIVSPTIPQYNTNAGDYRVWMLTKELSKYFNIFFMALDYKSSNVKYIENLNHNICKIVKPAGSKSNFKKIISQYDIHICLFEKYWSMPFDIHQFVSISPFSIIDIHELGFLKTAAQSKIQTITNATIYKAKELLFYKDAHLLIAITEEEKTELKKYFPEKQIVVIPTCTEVNTSKFKNFLQRKDICYFGFFKHQPNIDAASYFAANIFPKLQKKIPDIKFHILGNGSKIFENNYNNVLIKDNITNIPKELSNYKVFVCPLRYGAGLKKKILDSMASKTPIISTSFGFEGINTLQSQSLEINSPQFIDAIVNVYTDNKMWNQLSKQNFNIVKKYYSLQSFTKYVKHFVKTIII